ncbi:MULTISPECIES: type III secretion system outer membrane ring subunit SctC [Paraburkholderia]|uniref:Type 3 secretion system secretin n=1 Tax=Paraburkholderia terricola TaxID=169427 RepID=A0A1M6MQJ2_9BURK|nr:MULTISPECIES: type III secretion system outer membrane ring subunit SctC [Paraburkholderia]AXE96586.1 EscC/YscC/HrcC family type III secretion system outer membrane ring protein [Paraburkholderia terricola]ORC53097.1 EscC/YscC/HrcC family type III secretion system outer membrane ring protein [Burkholderia sp. A27]SDO05901.1 type III secretion protein C [Paraburkholderia sediminicola]SHJ85620.1 type III secretion protein C [Paraburkholderia terricola]
MKKKRLMRAVRLAASLAIALPALLGVRAEAAAIHWRSSVVHVSAEGQDVKDVLRDFTAGQGVPATISGDVHGTVSGRFDMPPQRFLDTLASTFGFVWFYDGSVLSISDVNTVTRRVIKLDHASAADLRSALSQLRVENPRFPVTWDESQGTALVSGPQPYVQLVAEIARRLDENAAQRSGSSIRVFQLRHAWAADHNVEIDGKTVTVSGVANVLSSMYHPRSQSRDNASGYDAATSRIAKEPTMRRLQPMRDVTGSMDGGGFQNSGVNPPLPAGMTASGGVTPGIGGLLNGMAAGGASGMQNVGNSAGNSGGNDDSADTTVSGSQSLPVIEADPRTNSVLIRDLPQRLPQYQTLIDQLDVRPRLIEIEAHIIEIDDNALKQIGVDWRAHNSHVDFQTGNGTTQQNGYNGNIDPIFGTQTLADGTTVISTTPVGGSLTAVLGSAGRYLLARVNALQQSNLAKIDASPKVATLNNVEAVMDQKTRFFVRVSGYTSADLYSVSTGVSLRVLPLVVEDNGKTSIKLNVHIEDGSVTSQQVDNIPVITTSTINTESFVGQGESLLIAGYRVDTATNGETGVPGLSKIPLLGALFRYRADERSHMERLFLLSPRIIEF